MKLGFVEICKEKTYLRALHLSYCNGEEELDEEEKILSRLERKYRVEFGALGQTDLDFGRHMILKRVRSRVRAESRILPDLLFVW